MTTTTDSTLPVPPAEALARTLDILERYGWSRGPGHETASAPRCLLIALCNAAKDSAYNTTEYDHVRGVLADAIRSEFPGRTHHPTNDYYTIVDFNEEVAHDIDDVRRVIRTARRGVLTRA